MSDLRYRSSFAPPASVEFDSSWRGEWIATSGAMLYVEQTGPKLGLPNLLCLHNFSSNSRARFADLLPLLSKQFNCLLLDLRGHGRSTNGLTTWSHELAALDIETVIETLCNGPVSVLATSSGAMAMLRVARRHPELIRAMILDSATYHVPPTARHMYKHPMSLSEKLQRVYKGANEVYGPAYWDTLAGVFYDFRLPDCDINVPEQWLSEISVPTHLIAGDRDPFFPLSIHIRMRELIPQSSLLVMPRTGHIVMEQHPKLVAESAINFLDSL